MDTQRMEGDFQDLENIYKVEDHAFACVHSDIGSIENEIYAENECIKKNKKTRS